MASVAMVESLEQVRREYLRPLWLGIIFAVAGEFFIFLIFGLLLNGPENWPRKLMWTVGFCGIGMGSTVGAFVDLLIVGRLIGARAIAATCALATGILGIACNVLCWQLDLGLHYFGGAEHPMAFLVSGMAASAVVGVGFGAVLFTDAGRAWLERRGL